MTNLPGVGSKEEMWELPLGLVRSPVLSLSMRDSMGTPALIPTAGPHLPLPREDGLPPNHRAAPGCNVLPF